MNFPPVQLQDGKAPEWTCQQCGGDLLFCGHKPAAVDVSIQQPLPKRNDRPAIQDLVIADIEKRKEVGLRKYGTLLQAGNGRDALQDAYEEALDLCQYLRQEIQEREDLRSRTPSPDPACGE